MPEFENEADDSFQEPGQEYGTVVALTETGDLKQNQLWDFANLHGVQAVVQDLKVALLTPQGADPMRPDYGIDIIRRFNEDGEEVSAIGTSIAEFKVAIREAIGPRADPRVQSIDDIEILGDEGNRDVSVRITLTLEEGPKTRFDFYPYVLQNQQSL